MRLFSALFLTLSLLWGSYAFMNQKTLQPVKKFDYASSWKKVQEFEDKGLPESALNIVREIYAGARAESDAQQLVKAMIFKMKYTDYKEEDAFLKNLRSLEEEIKTSEFPVTPLLHSMLAESYWSYYRNNRYRFDNRTATVSFDNNDIATWDLSKIVQETRKHYQLSLTDADRLKKFMINRFDEILTPGNTKGRLCRPTLYDFLAHRAVDFYKDEEPSLVQPAFVFTINSADYLKAAKTFCRLPLVTKDTSSFKYLALRILQDLIQFHLDDAEKEALVEVDLERLQFVSEHLTLPNTSDLYLEALQRLEQQTIESPVSTRVTCRMAELWREKGGQYNASQSDDHKWDLQKANDLCKQAMQRFPGSDGAAMAYNLQQEMLQKGLSVTIEKINVNDHPFRALVTYRNFTTLQWRILQVTRMK